MRKREREKCCNSAEYSPKFCCAVTGRQEIQEPGKHGWNLDKHSAD